MLNHVFNLFSVIVITTAASVSKYDYSKAVDFNTLPTPDQLVLDLTEDEYDDYLDYWLHQQFLDKNERQQRILRKSDGCIIPIRNLNEPLPIYATNNALLQPDGTSGNIVLNHSQVIQASCTGQNNGLVHELSSFTPKFINMSCYGDSFMTTPWVSSPIEFAEIKCRHRTNYTTIRTNSICSGGGSYLKSLLTVGDQQYSILSSCFHETRSEVLYVEYEQNPEHIYSQPNVNRPRFYQGAHFPDINVDELYTQVSQKKMFDEILGPSMNEKYINKTFFLSRGHLAAKTDYVLAAEQRATFTFVNAAPQWQPFNGGNWNTLEQRLRNRIGRAGYRTKIYTGTWGILQLADSSGIFRDIYLSPKTQQIPVPMWFYKVVHEPSTGRGVAFLGLNNPHVTVAEARELAFCTDICTDNPEYSWLTWLPTDIGRGFSLCCEVDDFRQTVTLLPNFTTSDILS